MKKASKWLKIVVAIVAGILVVGAVACLVYFNTGRYAAGETARAALTSDEKVTVTAVDASASGGIVFEGPDADPQNTYGFVFYPGAKVDEAAYAPLLHELASRGWICIALEVPFDFALFGMNAADTAITANPQVEHWYVGGHSLGGVVAGSYAAAHTGGSAGLEGLVFLAAYTTEDVSATQLTVASVYGTNDEVLDAEAYAEARPNLPAGTGEFVLEGGNHAQFGDYGEQAGDGVATISAEEQVSRTVDFVDECAKRTRS